MDGTSAGSPNQARRLWPCVLYCLIAAAVSLAAPGAPEAQRFPGSAQTNVPDIRYTLDSLRIEGNDKTSAGLIDALVGLSSGDEIGLFDVELVKRRLLSTGFFLTVKPRLEKAEEHGHVVLVLEVDERNTILLSDVFLGVSDSQGFWGGVDLVESNLLGYGLVLGSAFVVNQDQLATRLTLADPHAFSLPLRIGGTFDYAQGNESVFVFAPGPSRPEPFKLNFQRVGGELSAGFYPMSLLGVFLDVGVEGIDASSSQPELTQVFLREGQSIHSTLRMTLDHDTRDNPFVPTSGYRLNLSLQGSAGLLGSDYDYFKAVVRSAYYVSLGFNDAGHVLRFDLFGGLVMGSPPFFERFFVGDASAIIPSRDLGLNFSTARSPDFLGRGAGNLGYEKVIAGGGFEYGIPLAEGPAPFYRVEFFLGAGIFGMTTPGDLPGDRRLNLGSDLVRDRASSTFPIDLSFNLGFKAETPIGIFGLSFANALALVPF